MTRAFPGDICPKTGTWAPSDNPRFYPYEYAQSVMNRHFEAGERMPETPHGEPSWILQEQSTALENFSGWTPEQIEAHISKKDAK